MAQHGSWEDRPWGTRERGPDEERWRREARDRGEQEPRGREREEPLGAREEWRAGGYGEYGEPRAASRRYGPEHRPLAGERDLGWREGEREADWERRRARGDEWQTYGRRWPEERAGGYLRERDEYRPEIDPPWVERSPERRGRADSRGLVEWEDRGPLKWLGDKVREATGAPGKGPKGYTRSDERIFDDVCERIARSGIDADDVEVKVESREVTLSGTVRSRAEKWRLEEVAEGVFGVEDVHNHVRVPRAGTTEGGAGGGAH